MQTIQETRLARLLMLRKRYSSWAEFNEAMGYERTSPKFSRIASRTLRTDRKVPWELGDDSAREIEQKLNLPTGWMDTPPSYADLHGHEDPRAKLMDVMDRLPDYIIPTATKLLDALAEQQLRSPANGTT